MKFDLISDFHVEMNDQWGKTRLYTPGDPLFFAWHKARNEGSNILVMAGDTANVTSLARDVIVEAAQHYEHVVFVDGNHEHYHNFRTGSTVYRDEEWMHGMFTHRNRVVENATYLQGRVTYQIGRTRFIGANGWYNFAYSKGAHPKQQERDWRKASNDPTCIRFGKKHRPQKLARRDVDALKTLVQEAQTDDTVDEIVVVTHTLPTETALEQFASPTHVFFPLNGAYVNNWMAEVVEADKAGKIKTWCFGHTHERRDFFENGIRYVCNPRGYHGEKKWGGRGFQRVEQIDTEERDTGSAFGEIE